MQIKLTTLSIQIPYKRAGNTIRQEPVDFDVYQQGEEYRLVPLLSLDDRRVANLPEELVFFINEGKPVSKRGNKDGNFHVIQDAFRQLREQNLLAG